MDVLITGATGFLGCYLQKEFANDCNVATLGRSIENDFRVDLTNAVPVIDRNFDLVIHAAGSSDENNAMEVNLEGTRNLLKGLQSCKPKWLVFLSTVWVYGVDKGTDIDESYPANPSTIYGKSKLEAEKELTKWCNSNDVVITILRPTIVFGNGVHGKAKEMFDAIIANRYFHIRGNVAKRSVVMANDVAKVAKKLFSIGGVFNVCDGYDHSVIALADSMAENYGKGKRILYCPMKPIKWFAKIGDIIPPVRKYINSSKLNTLTSSLTFSNKKIKETIDINFFDTVDVIARNATDYPYEYND